MCGVYCVQQVVGELDQSKLPGVADAETINQFPTRWLTSGPRISQVFDRYLYQPCDGPSFTKMTLPLANCKSISMCRPGAFLPSSCLK